MLNRPLGSGAQEVEPEASAVTISPEIGVSLSNRGAFAGYVLMEGATGRG